MSDAEKLESLLLESLAKEQIIKQALGAEAVAITLSPSKALKDKQQDKEEEEYSLFKLPAEIDNEEIKKEVLTNAPICPRKNYDVNITKIDINSSHFKSLPADIRRDILMDIKETRKQNSWARLRELPIESQNFSSYQMERLLKRRQVQVSLELAEQEMGGKEWTLQELEDMLVADGVIEATVKEENKFIERDRFMYVRDITKLQMEALEPQPSTSKQAMQKEEKVIKIDEDNLGDEYDLDLQKAIQMSLKSDDDEEEQVKIDEKEPVKLNPQQRKRFGDTVHTHDLVRGFMMEYGQMNDADLHDLVNNTQLTNEGGDLNDSLSQKFPNTDKYVLYGNSEKERTEKSQEIKQNSNKIQENSFDKSEEKEIQEIVCEEETIEAVKIQEKGIVPDETIKTQKICLDQKIIDLSDDDECTAKKTKEIVITVDESNYKQEEDIFADIFERSQTPDIEVASISSDDDTVDYEVPTEFINKTKEVKDTPDVDSGFVSEEGKISDQLVIDECETSEIEKAKKIKEIVSENDKFWSNLNEEEENEATEICKDLSENEKFWSEIISDTEVDNSNQQIEMLDKAKVEIVNGEINVQLSPQKSHITKDEMTKVAEELRKAKTDVELEHMKDELHQQQDAFEKEKNKLNRQGKSITHQMTGECKKLLKLFGIPFIQSPMEAEAQCAFLNAIKLTDGTITDDSDIWLFGAERVYKNFFVQKKMVMEFRKENIEEAMNLDRKKLIQLAMLVGSDYTVGLNNVGAVTALEILASFPATPEEEGSTDQYQSMLSSLRKFRDWFQSGKPAGPNGRTILRGKLKNVELFDGFPSVNVLRAYLEPMIDSSEEAFTWGQIDVEAIMQMTKTKFGWTRLKTEEILNPVLKRINERKQASIKDYFQTQMQKKVFETQKLSKRVQKAVGRMGGKVNENEEEKKPKKQTTRKRSAANSKKNEAKKKDIPTFTLSESDDEEPPEKKSPKEVIEPETSQSKKSQAQSSKTKKTAAKKSEDKPKTRATRKRKEPSTSAAAANEDLDESLLFKKAPRIPETKQVIPQRERDKQEMEANKQKAIEIFKNSKKK